MDSNMADANLSADELDLAFHEQQKGSSRRLKKCVVIFYNKSLDASNFCVSHVNTHLFFHTIFTYLVCLAVDLSKKKEEVKTVRDGLSKDLFRLDLLKNALSVISNAAASFCVAAVIYKLNDVPKSVTVAAVAAAASVLIPALAKWGHSVLKKREITVEKRKKVTQLLIRSAEEGIERLHRIYEAGFGLELAAIASLSESTSLSDDDVEKAMANITSVEELLGKVEDYRGKMERAKEEVVKSITKHLG